jgi:hypothetical protein
LYKLVQYYILLLNSKYQETLKHFNLEEITIQDIKNDVDLVIEKVIGRMGYTLELHEQLQKELKCKLNSKMLTPNGLVSFKYSSLI